MDTGLDYGFEYNEVSVAGLTTVTLTLNGQVIDENAVMASNVFLDGYEAYFKDISDDTPPKGTLMLVDANGKTTVVAEGVRAFAESAVSLADGSIVYWLAKDGKNTEVWRYNDGDYTMLFDADADIRYLDDELESYNLLPRVIASRPRNG